MSNQDVIYLELLLKRKTDRIDQLERQNVAKDGRINMFKSYRDDFYEMEEKILELEKENAELKTKLKASEDKADFWRGKYEYLKKEEQANE